MAGLARTPDQSAAERFSPAQYVLSELERLNVSLAARHLALVLAVKLRLTADGHYRIWRGRSSLGRLTGLCTKSVTKARRELLEAGLFRAIKGMTEISTPSGMRHAVARGVLVLELVRDVSAFVEARDCARAENDRQIDRETALARLAEQKRCLLGEISQAELERRERQIRLAAAQPYTRQGGMRFPQETCSESSRD